MTSCKKFSCELGQIAAVVDFLREQVSAGAGQGGGASAASVDAAGGAVAAGQGGAGEPTPSENPLFSQKPAPKTAAATAGQSSFFAQDAHAIISLEGTLGAGKTTLARELLAALGASGGSSPTYLKMFEYPLARGPFTAAFHYDFYAQMSPDLAMALEENLLLPGLHIAEWLPQDLLARLAGYGLRVLRVKISPQGDFREYEIFYS